MNTVLHVVIGYVCILLTVRVLARRPGAQMTPLEFVLIFLIGGIIILASVGDDHSLTNCTCAVLAVGLIHRLVSWAQARNPRAAAWLDGLPLVLIQDGQWQTDAMEGLRVDPDDVMAAARTQGLTSLAKVKYAVAERTGAISIIKK
jgi:uncharacterized membrane protein YcaP (DUF421 family)